MDMQNQEPPPPSPTPPPPCFQNLENYMPFPPSSLTAPASTPSSSSSSLLFHRHLLPPSLLLNETLTSSQGRNQSPYLSDHIDWLSLLSGLSQAKGLPEQQSCVAGLGGGTSSSSSLLSPMINNSSNSSTYGAETTDDKEKKPNNNRRRKAARPSRVAFQTRTDDDILDGGYRWRKYGQKSVKNSLYPRSYYRCTHHTCNVKEQVQRLSKDTGVVVTTYEGKHNHPYEKLMETLSPLLQQIQFLAGRF